MSVPRPPALEGARSPRRGDAARIAWWSGRSFAYGVLAGRGPVERLTSALLALGWLVMCPIVVPLQAVLVARGAARYYVSQAGDAVLAVSAGRDGWCLEDHVSARPGTGQGRALRAVVLPQLLAAADAAGIEIHTTAATTTLARLYASEIPGLVDEGRGWPRGRRLRRLPAALGAVPG